MPQVKSFESFESFERAGRTRCRFPSLGNGRSEQTEIRVFRVQLLRTFSSSTGAKPPIFNIWRNEKVYAEPCFGRMHKMLEGHDLEVLQAASRRMYRQGGRGLSRGPVTLAALACGILPMLFFVPLGFWMKTPRLWFAPFKSIILEAGIPFSIILATAFSRRWVAAAKRRYPVIFAACVAFVLEAAIFGYAVVISGLEADELLSWIVLHLIVLTLWLVANVMTTGLSALPPRSVKPQSSFQDIADQTGHDLVLGEQAVGYRRSPSSRRRWRRLGIGRFAWPLVSPGRRSRAAYRRFARSTEAPR